MNVRIVLLVVAISLLRGASAMSQQSVSSEGPALLRETDRYRLHSRHVGADFEIQVARPLPAFMGAPSAAYEILYVLDGDLFFGMATDMTRLMHRLFGELPPILVVGIGYGTSDGRVQGETRNRDFTPSVDARMEAMAAQMRPDWQPLLPAGQRYGGAARFLDFLREEVQPLIAQNYPQSTGRSTLFGSSMGGLFAGWVMLTQPQAFDQYVIASPALWWDDHLLVRTAAEQTLLRGASSVAVFLGAGALEEGTGMPQLDEWRLVSNTRRLHELLRAREEPGIETSLQVFDGETHTSVVAAVLTRGLRALYRRR